MAYRADIEIGVKGAAKLKELQDRITRLSRAIDDANVKTFIDGKAVQSLAEYSGAAGKAAASLRETAIQLDAAGKASGDYASAISQLVTAVGQENAALEIQNSLIKEEIELRRKAKLAASGIREATQYAGPIGPGQASLLGEFGGIRTQLVGQTSPVAESIARNIAARKEELDLQQALLNLEEKRSTELNQQLQLRGELMAKAALEVNTLIAKAAAPSPRLALPSSEMLQAEQRGLKQLSTYYGDLNTEIDAGVQKGRAFTEQLNQSANAAQTLPPIFNQVQQGLQGTVKATATGNAIQANWARVLGEFPRIQADILKSQLAEININKESLQVDYARLQARKQMQRISAFEEGQAARAKRTQQLNESLALGVGFPLLFGGGVGTVAGSFAGSFAGKGFGGQIIGGALGQVAENVVRSIAKVTSSLDTMVAAAGIAGTATERHIEELKKAGKEEEALAVATAALANVVGQDGVKALKDFETAGTTLANSLSQLSTQLLAKAAQALGGPTGGIVGAIEESALFGQAQQSTDAQQIANFTKLARVYGQEYYDTLDAIYRRQRDINSEAEKTLNNSKEIATIRDVDRNLLNAEFELAKTTGNVLNDSVFALKKKVIEQRTYVALQDAVEKGLETESILLREQIDLQQLRVERQEAAARAAEKARQEAEATLKAQLTLEKALYDERTRLIAFNIREVEFGEGAEAALTRKLFLLPKEAELRMKSLDIERQQALQEAARNGTTTQTLELFERKRRLLELEYNLEKDITQEKRARLRVEQFQQTLSATQQAAKPFEDVRRQQLVEIQLAKTYSRLIYEGVLPAEAERIVNYEKLATQELEAVNRQINLVEAVITQAEKEGAKTDEYKKQLDLLVRQKDVIKEQAALGPGKGPTDTQRLENAITKTRGELTELANPINAAITGANAIGSAFQQAFQGIVTGTMTAQEALSGFFKSVGEAFVSMAAEIIAKQLVMITLQTILKALGVASSGGGGGGDALSQFNASASKYGTGMGFTPFAAGGFVTSPTSALIGEGGEPEYIIPASKMAGAMQRYSAGARGSNVIPDSGSSGGGIGAGGTNTYTLETVVINNVEYATVEQVREFSALAARQGAEGGYNRTMGTLRNSRSQRSRIGLR